MSNQKDHPRWCSCDFCTPEEDRMQVGEALPDYARRLRSRIKQEQELHEKCRKRLEIAVVALGDVRRTPVLKDPDIKLESIAIQIRLLDYESQKPQIQRVLQHKIPSEFCVAEPMPRQNSDAKITSYFFLCPVCKLYLFKDGPSIEQNCKGHTMEEWRKGKF